MTLFDAVALICGTAVGGGFLAIPEVTAPLGVLPSAVGLSVTWLFLMMAGLAYVEAAGAVNVNVNANANPNPNPNPNPKPTSKPQAPRAARGGARRPSRSHGKPSHPNPQPEP